MANLDDLVPTDRYRRNDYIQMLKALLPRGKLWEIALPIEPDIRPIGIPSVESVNEPTMLWPGNQLIQADSLPTEGVVGAPDLLRQSISVPSIVSEEVVGSAVYVLTNVLNGHDFNSGSLGSGWDSAFTTDWGIETEDGQNIAQSPVDGLSRLYPATSGELTGDFTFYWDYWVSALQAGNISIHIQAHDSLDVLQFKTLMGVDVMGIDEATPTGNLGTPDSSDGPLVIPMKLSRVSGQLEVSHWNGTSWDRADTWATPETLHSDSDDVYFSVDGADGVNGLSRIYIVGTLA